MSAFSTIASQWTVNVSDITNALKEGTLEVREAAALLDRVKLVDVRNESAKHLTAINYVGNKITDEARAGMTHDNSYEGLKLQLSEPEHAEKYHELMKLRGLA
jgi:hypothetical protein